MRFAMAQIVVLAACLLAGVSRVNGQAASLADRDTCPLSSEDEQNVEPEITIAQVDFSGASQVSLADQHLIATSIKENTRGTILDQVTDEALERARAGWQDRGYFKAEVTGDVTTVASTALSLRLALSVHVDEGQQYKLGAITFKNNKVIANAPTLRELFPLKDGEIFSREKVATGIEKLRAAYAEIGYINFTSIPDTTFDEDKRLIYLDVNIDEGKQFYVGSVHIIGLSEPRLSKVLADFSMQRGQVYNGRLFERFLVRHGSEFHYWSGLDRQLDEKSGLVTFTFDFRPCPGD